MSADVAKKAQGARSMGQLRGGATAQVAACMASAMGRHAHLWYRLR